MSLASPGPEARDRPMAAINVTPMADVIITLLIIFMVVTPMFGHDAHVRLPEADGAAALRGTDDVVLRVRDDGAVLLGERRIDTSVLLTVEMRDQLSRSSATPRRIRIEADAALEYSRVSAVLDACREAGAAEMLLVTRPKDLAP